MREKNSEVWKRYFSELLTENRKECLYIRLKEEELKMMDIEEITLEDAFDIS